MQKVELALAGGRGYAIHVGHGILPALGEECARLGLGPRVAAVADAAVTASCLAPATASLGAAGFAVEEILYDGGEAGKNLSSLEAILGRLIEAELDRGSWILAVGGGVVGDLAGFAAATYQRGIDFVQVPTTVVAQVDASVGGKTAVNHRLGKNMVGAFHQPRLVWIDTHSLRSLPREERAAGFGEVVKHAVIRDPELFDVLEAHLEEAVDLRLDPERLDWLITRNVEIKAAVVGADEREGGVRAILNYGHTIGHAIEAATGYSAYRHGEAVALGMLGAAEIAARRNLWPVADRQRHDALLERLGVRPGLSQVPAAQIVARTRADKKRRDGRLRFVLPRRLGEVTLCGDVEEDEVRAAVTHLQERYP
ncbi:MAG: 3-dehydroquinate synthase [Gemmatimonadota bacterium]